MKEEKRYLEDVGMKNLPFPMKVISKVNKNGQPTIADISISARIMHEFEAGWIDKFIQIVHNHRDRIGTKTLKVNIKDYVRHLKATSVKIDFQYPFFIEKRTPVSKEKCLVRYLCSYSVKTDESGKPRVIFGIKVPCISTYPLSFEKQGGLFGQLSVVGIETESRSDVYPEDLVALVDKHALMPVYSFLTEEDQAFVIEKVHSQKKTSVVMIDEIKDELSHMRNIESYKVECSNFGMLHSYSTSIGTEKSMWIPFNSYEPEK
ncbi:MAG: GTP cyclohydrolase, FolE2/MptA family [Candidatus Omnitrophica bacterium]|nr:GTP cyclohydrolase, FolE2/MptA family [Candidatus Omnitrophota bacterium]